MKKMIWTMKYYVIYTSQDTIFKRFVMLENNQK